MSNLRSSRKWLLAAAAVGAAAALGLAGAVVYFRWSKRHRHQRLADYKQLAQAAKRAPVVDSDAAFAANWPQFEQRARSYGFCGLDCEWYYRNELGEEGPLALLQLASPDGHILLLRVQKLSCLPEQLVEFLADERLLKFGVGIDGDARKIQSGLDVQLRGAVDLRQLLQLRRFSLQRYGLKSLAATLLSVDYNHLKKEATSNWEAAQLSSRQVEYAALDALVGALLAVEACCCSCSSLAEALRQCESSGCVLQQCQQIADVKFVGAPRGGGGGSSGGGGGGGFSSSASVRQNPLYHNCQMQAPDGQLICTLDRRKADWYVSKKLADIVAEEPLTIRLKFEPRARPSEEQAYYLADKVNQCVVCGHNEQLRRKKIVPDVYRKHFPEFLKSHKSHDVVLLCCQCHSLSEQHTEELKKQMTQTYAASSSTAAAAAASHSQREIRNAKSAAKALLLAADGKAAIPQQRQQVLRRSVQQHLGVEAVSEAELRELCQVSDQGQRVANGDLHGAKVVSAVLDEGRILEFEQMWRRHFVQTMRPQFMPQFWSEQHQHSTLLPAVEQFLSERNTAAATVAE